MTFTRQQTLIEARKKLSGAGIDTAALDARLLLLEVCGITHEELVLDDGAELSTAELERFELLLARRYEKEPMAYILGHQEFFGREFLVSPSVLIPRPDTEVLIVRSLEFLREQSQSQRILDLGTGSGAIILTLLSEVESARGLAIDFSEDALSVAQENATRIGVSSRVDFQKSDWAKEVSGTFDLIVSNPPYITKNDMEHLMKDVRAYEPEGALIGGDDGLDPLRKIAEALSRLLNSNGLFLAEIGLGQADAAEEILTSAGLQTDQTLLDLNGIPRCLIARW